MTDREKLLRESLLVACDLAEQSGAAHGEVDALRKVARLCRARRVAGLLDQRQGFCSLQDGHEL